MQHPSRIPLVPHQSPAHLLFFIHLLASLDGLQPNKESHPDKSLLVVVDIGSVLDKLTETPPPTVIIGGLVSRQNNNAHDNGRMRLGVLMEVILVLIQMLTPVGRAKLQDSGAIGTRA